MSCILQRPNVQKKRQQQQKRRPQHHQSVKQGTYCVRRSETKRCCWNGDTCHLHSVPFRSICETEALWNTHCVLSTLSLRRFPPIVVFERVPVVKVHCLRAQMAHQPIEKRDKIQTRKEIPKPVSVIHKCKPCPTACTEGKSSNLLTCCFSDNRKISQIIISRVSKGFK